VATIVLEQGTIVSVSCSWHLHAGRDAVIQAEFYGTEGGASLFNLEGSFYALTGERFSGTSREALCAPQTDWGARAALGFVSQLAQSKPFSKDCERLVAAASVIEGIYRASEAMSLAPDLSPPG
jgi:predicted dehydrogenase